MDTNPKKQHLASVEQDLAKLTALRDHLAREIARDDELSLRTRFCVQVVCLTCRGTGRVGCGGADFISDPPDYENCDDCEGCGFRWAVQWCGGGISEEIAALADA